MVPREIRRYAEEHRQQPIALWGTLIALYSLLEGQFYFMHEGYLISSAEPFMKFLPEKLIGAALIIAALIKLIGVFSRNDLLKRIGIWMCTALWSGLFVVAFTFSFGTGYPNDSWINKGLVLAICIIISTKGDYYPYEFN